MGHHDYISFPTFKKRAAARSVLFLSIYLVFSACSLQEPTATPSAIPPLVQQATGTHTPQPPAASLETPDLGQAQTAMPPASPANPPTGPWVIFLRGDGLWTANPDGTGLTQIAGGLIRLPSMGHLDRAISPSGGLIAWVSGTDDRYHNLVLHVFQMSSRKELLALPLTSSETEPPADLPAGSDFSPWMAVGETAWSPDGTRLAFTGLQDGPSSDVYIYTLADGTVTRLTDGPSQAYQLSWSPDGKYLLHYGVESFGSGAGYNMAGAWVIRMEDETVIDLYQPANGSEEVLGWISPRDVMINSWSAICGSYRFRTMNIETGAVVPVFDSAARSAVLDPASGVLLLMRNPSGATCEIPSSLGDGIFLFQPGNPNPLQVSQGGSFGATWSVEAGLFLLPGLGMGVSPGGEINRFPEIVNGFYASYSRTGMRWAWNSAAHESDPDRTGIWVSLPDGQPIHIFKSLGYNPQWSPDGQTLIFLSTDGIYVAHAPDFIPLSIAGWVADDIALVQP